MCSTHDPHSCQALMDLNNNDVGASLQAQVSIDQNPWCLNACDMSADTQNTNKTKGVDILTM